MKKQVYTFLRYKISIADMLSYNIYTDREQYVEYESHRSKGKTCWGTELIQFHAALEI